MYIQQSGGREGGWGAWSVVPNEHFKERRLLDYSSYKRLKDLLSALMSPVWHRLGAPKAEEEPIICMRMQGQAACSFL